MPFRIPRKKTKVVPAPFDAKIAADFKTQLRIKDEHIEFVEIRYHMEKAEADNLVRVVKEQKAEIEDLRRRLEEKVRLNASVEMENARMAKRITVLEDKIQTLQVKANADGRQHDNNTAKINKSKESETEVTDINMVKNKRSNETEIQADVTDDGRQLFFSKLRNLEFSGSRRIVDFDTAADAILQLYSEQQFENKCVRSFREALKTVRDDLKAVSGKDVPKASCFFFKRHAEPDPIPNIHAKVENSLAQYDRDLEDYVARQNRVRVDARIAAFRAVLKSERP